MSYNFDDNNGDWNSHTFPYNLSTFTASSNVHPDLPSEPPGYDEFEFSFPSELSPSLFGLPFLNEDGGTSGRGGILSPTGSSFPALSTTSHSPAAWADQYLAKSPPQASTTMPTVAAGGPSNSIASTAAASMTRGHTRQDSAVIAKKLFEDDERNALDEFFNKTLDEAATHDTSATKEPKQSSACVAEGSAAVPHRERENTVSASASPVIAEPRKRTRKAPPSKINTSVKPLKASKAASTSKAEPNAPLPVAKQEEDEDEEDAVGELEDSKPAAKRGRTDSASVPSAPSASRSAGGTGKRSSHIASEQKRRSTIKDNYKCLVDLLLAGEASSGISLLGGGENEDDEGDATVSTKKSKPKGRGRGRKGQDGAGATKSVVLERAADYLKWLDRGNDELENEIGRLEAILAK